MNLKIRDVAAINNADIAISKINVVGGVNASGKSTVSKILYCFLRQSSDVYCPDFEALMKSEGLGDFTQSDIKFTDNNTHVTDIFYIDTISVFDLKNLEILKTDHISHTKEALEDDSRCSPDCESLEKLKTFSFDDIDLTTPSGIKQIGIIQALLQNGKLSRDCFLIIDEPEANLHPAWQIRFAQVLVLLSKEFNIGLYINSNSPMFIEAVSLYAEYYDLLDETRFYLTQRQENDRFDFTRIPSGDMGAVYENLTKPYDELDRLRAKILFKE